MSDTSKPANLDALLAMAKGTRWESVARDEKALERLLVEEMKKSTDPMTKEIGSGLADGSMTWRSVATSSAYAEFLEQGAEGMRDFDFAAAFGGAAEGGDAGSDKDGDSGGDKGSDPGGTRQRPRRDYDEDEPFERDIVRKRK
jgi:hypothetical protein